VSRIGKQPIPIPSEVEIDISLPVVTIKGPKGTLSQAIHPNMGIEVIDNTLTVSRPSDNRTHKALHGLTRSLLANMVTGVTQGFERVLELVGVGYRVQQSGEALTLQLGFSHPVNVKPLSGITLEAQGNNRMLVQGTSKQAVGEMAARIRKLRPPNRYTGKGVRYSGELVRLKPGKAAGRKK
jgi:large subunit ribosomal protein L6